MPFSADLNSVSMRSVRKFMKMDCGKIMKDGYSLDIMDRFHRHAETKILPNKWDRLNCSLPPYVSDKASRQSLRKTG